MIKTAPDAENAEEERRGTTFLYVGCVSDRVMHPLPFSIFVPYKLFNHEDAKNTKKEE
jgi:hypothetical protein